MIGSVMASGMAGLLLLHLSGVRGRLLGLFLPHRLEVLLELFVLGLGRPMPVIDLMIAAIAFNLGNCTVVSNDVDRAAVPGLAVENWATGPRQGIPGNRSLMLS